MQLAARRRGLWLAAAVAGAGACAGILHLWRRKRLLIAAQAPTAGEAEAKAEEEACVLWDAPELDRRIARKAEAVIRWRTSRVLVVVERCTASHNYSAIMRTAEALGIQHVWLIDCREKEPKAPTVNSSRKPLWEADHEELQQHAAYAKKAVEWLSVQQFETTAECVDALKADGRTIWATDLSQHADCLVVKRDGGDRVGEVSVVPERLAIVFGTESVGCTQEMLEKADRRVYLPLRGFADSLNLSVACSLVIQQLFHMAPEIVGSMSNDERHELRTRWMPKLVTQRAGSGVQRKELRSLRQKLGRLQRVIKQHEQGITLNAVQQAKLATVEPLRAQLRALEAQLAQEAEDAAASLIDAPPEPLGSVNGRARRHRGLDSDCTRQNSFWTGDSKDFRLVQKESNS